MATIVTSVFLNSAEWIQDEQRVNGSAEQVANKIERAFANGRIVGLIEGAERVELLGKENEGRMTRFRGLIDGTNKLTITIL